jgi:RecJ-like exonuclease
MVVYVSKVHSCHGQEAVVLQEQEPPAKKCRCKQVVTIMEATRLVNIGEAKWVVKQRSRGFRDVICEMCNADPEVRNCARCRGTGKQTESYVEDIPGTDIVYTSSDPVDETERKKRKWLAPKTPRVATIESEHIERAYVEGNKDAQDRIEEYGMLILDARTYVGPKRIPAIKPEPEDNEKTHEGRYYDFGRAI